MIDTLFSITSIGYNLSDPPTGVTLVGGPILDTIGCLNIFMNDINETSGVLRKFSSIATIVASPVEFEALCAALRSNSVGRTLCVTYELVEGRRLVRAISVQEATLRKIEQEVTKTAGTTEQIYEVVSTELPQLLQELRQTNEILRHGLRFDPLGPNGAANPSSTPPPEMDREEPEPAH